MCLPSLSPPSNGSVTSGDCLLGTRTLDHSTMTVNQLHRANGKLKRLRRGGWHCKRGVKGRRRLRVRTWSYSDGEEGGGLILKNPNREAAIKAIEDALEQNRNIKYLERLLRLDDGSGDGRGGGGDDSGGGGGGGGDGNGNEGGDWQKEWMTRIKAAGILVGMVMVFHVVKALDSGLHRLSNSLSGQGKLSLPCSQPHLSLASQSTQGFAK